MATHHLERGWSPGGAHAEDHALTRSLRRVLGRAGATVTFAAADEKERRAAPALEGIKRPDGTLSMRIPALTLDLLG